MREISILIPSYKRPSVLELTLKNLYFNTNSNINFKVNIGVGLNKASDIEKIIVKKYESIFEGKEIPFHSISYDNNMGKATILNILFKLYANNSDLIITMDNDMVISEPWLYLIPICDAIDYDIMGFSSAKFWAHDPIQKNCAFIGIGGHMFYKPHSVAGGMMLFHKSFLEKHQWTNHGGVYGRDDAEMCLLTKKKYVIYSDRDWLVHDPLSYSTEELKSYEDKKKALYNMGIPIFPDGWDE